MRREDEEAPSDGGLEGGGPGGGTEIARQSQPEPRPGGQVFMILTAILVFLVLLVPVLWALGVYTGLTVIKGLDPAAQAGYFLLFVLLFGLAVLYFWAQFRKSA